MCAWVDIMVDSHARSKVAFGRETEQGDQRLSIQTSQHSIRFEHNRAEAKRSEAEWQFGDPSKTHPIYLRGSKLFTRKIDIVLRTHNTHQMTGHHHHY